MQSLVLMTVLSGAAHAPEQYYYPCCYTRVYYGPAVAYVAAEPVYAADSGSTKRKLDDLAAQLARITDRVDAVENRHRRSPRASGTSRGCRALRSPASRTRRTRPRTR